MAIVQSAYNTTAHMGDKLEVLINPLTKALLTDSLRIMRYTLSHDDEKVPVVLVEGGSIAADSIPYFNHPIIISNPKDHKEIIVAVDCRNFGIYNKPSQKFIVRNKTELQFAVQRSILNYIWITGRKEALRDVSSLPAAAYASLVSESVGRRYALNMQDQMIIQVLACFFYYSSFVAETTLDEMQYDRIVGAIARCTRVPAESIYSILDNSRPISTLSDLCEACKVKTGSVALENFDVGILFSIVAGSWIGTNSRDLVCVGLDHIPTWLMIVFAGVTEATYKRSVLAKLMERVIKRHNAETFVKNLNVIFSTEEGILNMINSDEII